MKLPTHDELDAALRWLDQRVEELWPGELSHGFVIGAAVISQLTEQPLPTLPPDMQARIDQDVEAVLWLEQKDGSRHRIGSLVGMAQVAMIGLDRMDSVRPPESGGWSPWTCGFCRKEFEADFAPDHCPDCGARLTRVRRASREEIL
jgi:hypothetical protein